MPISELRLIKNSMEYIPKDEINNLPFHTRGIYVLYKHRRRRDTTGKLRDNYDVVYVGMARGLRAGIKGRLITHRRSKSKGDLWTHFSAFEVWDNIREDEIAELEGIFRHIYRLDSRASQLNKQRSYKPLNRLRKKCKKVWA